MNQKTKEFTTVDQLQSAEGKDLVATRARIEALERLLEGLIVIPVINRKVGLDSLIGLVPAVGDAITAILGAYMVWEARNLGLSRWQLTHMAMNIGTDTVIGAIPVLGDTFDFLWRSNTKNLQILKKHLDRHHPKVVTIDQ